jgi:hypothetical protein
MLYKLVFAMAVLAMSLGVALADEMRGVITKFDKDQLTFKEGKKGAKAMTYELAKEVKVFRFVKKNQKEVDPDGLKADPLPNLPKGGVLAVINVVDGKVTEISIPIKKKKKN